MHANARRDDSSLYVLWAADGTYSVSYPVIECEDTVIISTIIVDSWYTPILHWSCTCMSYQFAHTPDPMPVATCAVFRCAKVATGGHNRAAGVLCGEAWNRSNTQWVSMRLKGKFRPESMVYGMLSRDEAQVCLSDMTQRVCMLFVVHRKIELQVARSLRIVNSGVGCSISPHVDTNSFAQSRFELDWSEVVLNRERIRNKSF